MKRKKTDNNQRGEQPQNSYEFWKDQRSQKIPKIETHIKGRQDSAQKIFWKRSLQIVSDENPSCREQYRQEKKDGAKK